VDRSLESGARQRVLTATARQRRLFLRYFRGAPMALDPDKSLLGRVTQSIPEFLSIPHAIDNDFHLRPSLLRRADVITFNLADDGRE
jgi:hypothetical protein